MNRWIAEHALPLAVALLAAAAGCAVVQELAIYRKRPVRFSHATHGKRADAGDGKAGAAGKKADLECADCHRKFTDSDDAGMPRPKSCRLCHKGREHFKQYLRPFLVEGKVLWTQVTDLSDEIIFSHKLHHEKKVACENCHQGITTSTAVSAALRSSKDDCLDCHVTHKVSGECGVCHRSIDREWTPPSHRRNWKRFHGQVVRAGKNPPFANRCSLCHTDASCSSCHQDEPPRNHTSHWRHRGHGITAGIDRDNCATCHRTDFCDRCHRDTAPRNHTASWGSPRDRHCFTCHLPLQNEQCFVCHKSDPSHQAAPIMPGNTLHAKATAANCRACHFGTMRHGDNGDNCRLCHG